jgi:hypothetical protein
MKIIITEQQSKLLRSIISEQSEDDEFDLYIRRRVSLIDELIEKNIDEVEQEGTLFNDEFEFADNIISWVVQGMKVPDNIDEDEVIDYMKDEYGGYIMSRFNYEDVEEDEYFEYEDEEDDDEDDEWDEIDENWSQKYKRSIDCNNPKGFSQKAHCQGRKKRK